ncbi:MAG: hypothetical protein K2Y01_06500 [Rhabdochlamydiaceae bacterium]|nr:hypothetical protein [Rhabdochlamydiaceae bacterium]
MNVNSELFLYKGNAAKNLETLTSFDYADTSKTKYMTEEVYKKAPKNNISKSTLNEICWVSCASMIASGPFLFTIKKVYDCTSLVWSTGLEEAKQCGVGLTEALGKPINQLTYLCFASMVALAGVGVYTAARSIFQDRSQEERYSLLSTEYNSVMSYLKDQYNTVDKTSATDSATKLLKNADWIRASLIEDAKLSSSQADKIIAQIKQTANRILQNNSTAIVKQAPVTTLPESSTKKPTVSPKRLSPNLSSSMMNPRRRG